MDKNRPIVVSTLGYIIGIIWGLYFDKTIVSYFICIIAILVILDYIIKIFQKSFLRKEKKQKFKFFSVKRILRYIKLVLNFNTIIIFIIFFIISKLTIQILEDKYNKLYLNVQEINAIAKVLDNGSKKEYSTMYKIKIETINNSSRYKNTNLYLKINNSLNINLQYGDKIQINGKYIEPERARNYKGFNYSMYLRTLKIYGTVKGNKVKVIEKNTEKSFFYISNKVFLNIKEQIEQSLSKENANLLLGILFGYTDEISEDTKELFKQSNISHILAVSGMHISYIIVLISEMSTKINGKRGSRLITIFFIIAYMFITNFTPSVTRAGITGIIVLLAKATHNKNDISTAIAISIVIILIYNPYLITDAGLLLSYGGTIGILLFQKIVTQIFSNIKAKSEFYKYKASKIFVKIVDYIQDTIAVSISAQIVIAPIMIQIFNTFGITFFITNFFVSLVIGPIIIIGFLFIFFSFLYQHFLKILILNQILKLIYNILKFSIEKLLLILMQISKLGKILPLSSINVITLPMWLIIVYYIVILLFNEIYKISSKKQLTAFDKRIINWKNLIKHKFRKNKQRIIAIIVVIAIILYIIKITPNDLKIHFIDVGQGDCTLIITPAGKKILVDGGGSDNYNIGKKTLLPYLLDRRITKLDYVIISHFDSDHVKGIITILEELDVEKVLVSKQYQNSENYKEFLEIIKEKNITIKQVSKGYKINIEKDLTINILFPIKDQLILENSLNNNSIVAKLVYKNFSMLFTGDIEKIAEEKILKEVNGEILKSYILKVAHHGSKTSSIAEFIKNVNPQIAIIGVGENNKFGHPNNDVLNRLYELRCKNL
jgi:competence protein ComEC